MHTNNVGDDILWDHPLIKAIFCFLKVIKGGYQDQGSLCKQLEQKKQDSTCVAEVQEAISEAPVV